MIIMEKLTKKPPTSFDIGGRILSYSPTLFALRFPITLKILSYQIRLMADFSLRMPKFQKTALLVCLYLLIFIAVAYSSGADNLKKALEELCCQLQRIVPVTAMLLVIAAGVIYSIGQMFGAETRARANVWSTSCLTGAVIGILISQVAPHILGIIADASITCGCV